MWIKELSFFRLIWNNQWQPLTIMNDIFGIFSSRNKNRFKIDQLVLRAVLGSFIWVLNRVRFFSLAAIMSLCYDLRGCCARFLSKTFLFSSNISSNFEILLGIKLCNIFTKVSVNIYVYPGRLKFQTY